MKSIAVTDFKAHCLGLLEDIARTGEPLLVTKRGKPLARILPSTDATTLFPQDTLAGTVTIGTIPARSRSNANRRATSSGATLFYETP